MKFIFSFDFGCSFIKILIMSINQDNIEKVLMDKINADIEKNEFEKYFFDTLKKYNIDKNDIESIIICGINSIKYKKIFPITPIILNEFEANAYSTLLLSGKKEALIVSIGTGTSFVYSNLNKVEHLGGTALGGGTIIGMCKRFNISNDFNEIIDKARQGNYNNVDLLIGDIAENDAYEFDKNVTISNFANIKKKVNNNDLASAIINLVIQNIGLFILLYKQNLLLKLNKKNIDVIVVGTIVNIDLIKEYLSIISKYTNVEYTYLDDSAYTCVIGAYEYYMLRLKKFE